jgi:hypothetical protein
VIEEFPLISNELLIDIIFELIMRLFEVFVMKFILDCNKILFELLFVYDINSKLELDVLINGLWKFDEDAE